MPELTKAELTNERRRVHAAALGYTPMGMKPAHLLSGLLLGLDSKAYELKRFNQAVITQANKGLHGSYLNEEFHRLATTEQRVTAAVSEADLWRLRLHNYALFNNDQAAYPAHMEKVKESGVDYTTASSRLVTKARRNDGGAGPFVISILERSEPGRAAIERLNRWTAMEDDALTRLAGPWLRDDCEIADKHRENWEDNFAVDETRRDSIAQRMVTQTGALELLTRHLSAGVSTFEALRHFVIGAGCWLTAYLLKISPARSDELPVIFCDFSGITTSRTRNQSRLCYRRCVEEIEDLYLELYDRDDWPSAHAPGELFADKKQRPDFDLLRDHFNELVLRMGLAQPRSGYANKHFETQPDTLRSVLLSVIEPDEAVRLDDLALRLRATWGLVFGGRTDDHQLLAQNGYQGMDEDDLRRVNQRGFIRLAQALSMACEPSDGLVLFGQHVDTLI